MGALGPNLVRLTIARQLHIVCERHAPHISKSKRLHLQLTGPPEIIESKIFLYRAATIPMKTSLSGYEIQSRQMLSLHS
jgi:hypothetical protein